MNLHARSFILYVIKRIPFPSQIITFYLSCPFISIKGPCTSHIKIKAAIPRALIMYRNMKVTFRSRGTPDFTVWCTVQFVTVLTVSFKTAYFSPNAISKLEITEPCKKSLLKKGKSTL